MRSTTKVLTPQSHVVVVEPPRRAETWAMCLMDVDRDGHRFEVIRLIRNGEIVDCWRDIGLASTYTCGPIMVIGAPDGTDTVGELQDAAQEERESTGLVTFLQQKAEQSTLISDYIEQELMAAEFQRRNPRTAARLY